MYILNCANGTKRALVEFYDERTSMIIIIISYITKYYSKLSVKPTKLIPDTNSHTLESNFTRNVFVLFSTLSDFGLSVILERVLQIR